MKINIPGCNTQKISSLKKKAMGYKNGYCAGFSGSANISVGEDIVCDDYLMGYSRGYRDGTFDRENGNTPTRF